MSPASPQAAPSATAMHRTKIREAMRPGIMACSATATMGIISALDAGGILAREIADAGSTKVHRDCPTRADAGRMVVRASRRAGIPHVTRDEDALAVIHHTAETVAIAPADGAAVARWQERHSDSAVSGTR